MEVSTDIGYQIVARKIMESMLYDNGAVNRLEPDNEKRYPKVIFNEITLVCEKLFEKCPELLNDDNLELIACGCEDDQNELFGKYPEYDVLNEVLNRYFDIM